MNAALQGRKGALHRGNTSSMAPTQTFIGVSGSYFKLEAWERVNASGKAVWVHVTQWGGQLVVLRDHGWPGFLADHSKSPECPLAQPFHHSEVPAAQHPLEKQRRSHGKVSCPPLPTCPTCAGFSFFLIEKGIYTFPSFFPSSLPLKFFAM